MKKNKWLLMINILMVFCVVSCEKEGDSNKTKAVFSYVADGFLVNFTNFSTNATEYLWEFDDGDATSTLSNPSHVFPEKGAYLVSLTAKNENETSTFIDTVRITGPNIKIDGDFTDWAHVGYTHENTTGSSTILAVKTFADGKNLNFYIEGTSEMLFEVIQIFLDTDNNTETGLAVWFYPAGAGADILFEGNVDPADPLASLGAVSEYTGDGNSWAWNSISTFGEMMKFSEISDYNERKVMEFSIERELLGDMNEVVNFAILDLNSGYTELGSIPLDKSPDSKFAQISL